MPRASKTLIAIRQLCQYYWLPTDTLSFSTGNLLRIVTYRIIMMVFASFFVFYFLFLRRSNSSLRFAVYMFYCNCPHKTYICDCIYYVTHNVYKLDISIHFRRTVLYLHFVTIKLLLIYILFLIYNFYMEAFEYV